MAATPRAESPLGIVLAAGASRRAGFCKALATLDGQPFVCRIAATLRAGGCADVIVVVGPPHSQAIRELYIREPHEGVLVENERPQDGMLSSLQRGLRALPPNAPAAIIALTDHPRVRSSTIEALVDRWRRTDALFVRPRHRPDHGDARHGHPYLIDRALFESLLGASLEHGARPILRAAAPSATVDVDDPGVLDELNTPAALRAIGARPPME